MTVPGRGSARIMVANGIRPFLVPQRPCGSLMHLSDSHLQATFLDYIETLQFSEFYNQETGHPECKYIEFILKNAEGVQDEGIKEELDDLIPLIAVKKMLSRAILHLISLEPGVQPSIIEFSKDCNGGSAMGILSDIVERVEIDIKGFVIYPGDIDDRLKVRFAKRFGGKG